MGRYIFSFKSNQDVLDFLKIISPANVEFSIKNNIVICTCSETELELAVNGYQAEIDQLDTPKLG
jgi:hypothetical protein